MIKRPVSSDAAEALEILRRMAEHKRTNKLMLEYAAPWTKDTPGPYPWQVEFHDRGAKSHTRAVISANRVGKTRMAAAELAIHLTGRYPQWWKGHRFQTAIDALAIEPTNAMCKTIAQRHLLGNIQQEEGDRVPDGTGWIPKECIGPVSFRQCGISQVIDTAEIRSIFGGTSRVSFMSCEQGSTKFQGVEFDIAWMDEEPEDLADAWNIWSELNMRLALRNGHLMLTRTPLYGDTDIVRHVMEAASSDVWFKRAGWDDAPHWTQEQKDRELVKFKPHERDTRSKGYVLLGEGAVYDIEPADYVCDLFRIPRWYRRIVGIDFGIAEDHPAAGVWLAYDEDADVVYVHDSYRISHQNSVYHANAIRSRGSWIPVAWPHDGMLRDKATGGVQLAEAYRMHGANMLHESARYADGVLGEGSMSKGGGQSRAPITMQILERMQTGRIKIFANQTELLEELRGIHRKDNKIVERRDDLESALRYGIMMLRYAITSAETETARQATSDAYDPFSVYTT